MLACGVDTGVPGFASQDNTGKWKGFDIAYCRAIATAVLHDPEKVRYVPTTAAARFTILQSGEIDVLIRDSTLTFTRNVQLGLDEIAVNVLRRRGLPGQQEARRLEDHRAERRHDLRDHRRHAGAEHRRLRPVQRHQDRHAAVRQAGRGGAGDGVRPVRRLHRRHRQPRGHALDAEDPGRLGRAGRRDQQGAAGPPRARRRSGLAADPVLAARRAC